MRPYRLFNGVHVDLDHVLAINEPTRHAAWYSLDIALVMAFRDTAIVATVDMWSPEMSAYTPKLMVGEQILRNDGAYVNRHDIIDLRDTRFWHVVRDRYWQPIYDEWTRGKQS